ncbi:MAG: cytochrome C oxidase subunit IV family protein [Bryobacteraceae bacterium]|nr:cytochrome C oxidase subunit IV family protein [Bryobacteraceae bacterium]
MSAHEHDHASSHGDHHGPKNPPRVFTAVLIALLILTFITVGASYVNFGSDSVNVVIALTIATIKASLVALFFMHLKYDKPVNALIAVSGFLFLGLFLLFPLIDFESRMDADDPAYQSKPAAIAPTAPAAPQH